jgi:hypothetical protein
MYRVVHGSCGRASTLCLSEARVVGGWRRSFAPLCKRARRYASARAAVFYSEPQSRFALRVSSGRRVEASSLSICCFSERRWVAVCVGALLRSKKGARRYASARAAVHKWDGFWRP